MVPLEVALKGLEFAHVWDATARGTHSLQGGAVQLTSHRQGQAPLETLQRPTQGLLAVVYISHVGVALAVQILLRTEGQRRPSALTPFLHPTGPELQPSRSSGTSNKSLCPGAFVHWTSGLVPTQASPVHGDILISFPALDAPGHAYLRVP